MPARIARDKNRRGAKRPGITIAPIEAIAIPWETER